MYSTLGSSRLPVICVDSRSRRSLALLLLAAAGFAAGLLAAPAPGAAGLGAGFAAAGVAVWTGAEVFTPGSIESCGTGGVCAGVCGGVCAMAAPANNNSAQKSSLFIMRLLR